MTDLSYSRDLPWNSSGDSVRPDLCTGITLFPSTSYACNVPSRHWVRTRIGRPPHHVEQLVQPECRLCHRRADKCCLRQHPTSRCLCPHTHAVGTTQKSCKLFVCRKGCRPRRAFLSYVRWVGIYPRPIDYSSQVTLSIL